MLYHFPGDHRVLEQRFPRERSALSDDDREARFASLAAMRKEILMLVDSSAEMELLLRICNGELSCRDLAKELGVDPSTAWRTVQRRLQECRLVRATALAIESFKKGQGFTIDVGHGRRVADTDRHAVLLRGKQLTLPTFPSAAQIQTYLRKHARLLDTRNRPAHYFGGRIDGRFHLNIVRFIDHASRATDLALAEGHAFLNAA